MINLLFHHSLHGLNCYLYSPKTIHNKNHVAMKTIFTTATLFFFLTTVSAQLWVDVGARASYGIAWMYNDNIFNDSNYDYHFEGAIGFGGRLGLNFGSYHGINMEVSSQKMKQRLEYRISSTNNQNEVSNIEWQNLDLYFLYRMSSHQVFVEIGPMYSISSKFSHEDTQLQSLESALFAENNISDYSPFYRENYASAVLGFGGFLVGNDAFTVNLGFRLHYGLQDMVSDLGASPSTNPTIKAFPAPIRDESYPQYAKTNPLMAQVSLEFNFGVGGLAKTSCSKRQHWFWSGNR